MLDPAGVRHRRRGRLTRATVGRAPVLAVVDMPAAPMGVGVMTTPAMGASTTVTGVGDDGRRPRPNSGSRGEDGRNDETYENQEACHRMDPSLWPCGSRSRHDGALFIAARAP